MKADSSQVSRRDFLTRAAAVAGGQEDRFLRSEARGQHRRITLRTWPTHPVIYEINTWVWLGDLSRLTGRAVTLGTVPAIEWDRIAAGGFDAVWLMGVWQRSPAGIEISMRNAGLLEDFTRALPDFAGADNRDPHDLPQFVEQAERSEPTIRARA